MRASFVYIKIRKRYSAVYLNMYASTTLPACAAEGDMMTEAGAMRRTGPLLAPVLTTRAPV